MQDDAERNDTGRCAACGGRIAATHMLTSTYDVEGGWERRMGDFVEDAVVVCKECGREPPGRLEVRDDTFVFVPSDDERGTLKQAQ